MGAVARSTKHETGPRHPESKFFLAEKYLEALRTGITSTAACRLVGLNPQTLYDWTYNGRRDPEKYPEYAQLIEDIELVKAEVQKEMVEHITIAAKADPKHWTAAAWYLERTDPANWGKRDKVEVKNEGGPLIQLNQVILSDEAAREASRDLLNRLAAGRSSEPLGLGAGGESAGDDGEGGPEVIDVDPR